MADHPKAPQSHAAGSAEAGHLEHHDHGGVGKYMMVFGALILLTAASFLVANTPAIMQTPSVGWALMMAISCGKAMLVITFFMHLLWEANWKWVLTIPATIMSVFLVLMLVPDIGRRTENYSSERWLHAAVPQVEPAEEGAEEEASDEEEPAGEHGAEH